MPSQCVTLQPATACPVCNCTTGWYDIHRSHVNACKLLAGNQCVPSMLSRCVVHAACGRRATASCCTVQQEHSNMPGPHSSAHDYTASSTTATSGCTVPAWNRLCYWGAACCIVGGLQQTSFSSLGTGANSGRASSEETADKLEQTMQPAVFAGVPFQAPEHTKKKKKKKLASHSCTSFHNGASLREVH